jgi:hypothetical protein
MFPSGTCSSTTIFGRLTPGCDDTGRRGITASGMVYVVPLLQLSQSRR